MDEHRPELPADLQAEVERVARRLQCDVGERTVEFRFRDGRLAATFLHHGPIKNEELTRLARSER
jgi:hypothetical protein